MHWNHRVCKQTYKPGTPDEEVSYGIHEVYYNDKKEICATSETAINLVADDLEGIKWQLEHMMECLGKDVVDLDSIVYAKDEDD